VAKRGIESRDIGEQLMEEVCEQENGKQAWARVMANEGSSGVDGMTVEQLAEFLKQHWPVIRELLLSWGLCAATGKAGGDPEAGRRGAKLGIPRRCWIGLSSKR
jgi:RNA-directed DNA polymerase